MNILLIGSGGRESALAYKISSSLSLNQLYILPGNPGTSQYGININIDVNNHDEVLKFCNEKKIDLAVVGPEKPLVDGLSDHLRKNNLNVFGPDSAAAEIESSKTFAKNFMEQFNIPTSNYKEFKSSESISAKEYLAAHNYPLVIKADGLAAGKGVIICNNFAEAEDALDQIFENRIFGSAGDKIIIEDFLLGEEASIFAITDGENFLCLPSAQDYKRIGDNDTGKNTGGMGAYSPAPIVSYEILKQVEEKIITPTINGLKEIGRTFLGCLYCGLMIKDNEVNVVEFNCRFGDPETQAVLPLLEGDFLKLLYSASTGQLDTHSVKYTGGAAVTVVAASKGYPDLYQTGYEIRGLNEINEPEVLVFHAGTKKDDDKILTNGGRVINVTSVLKKHDLRAAKEKAYQALKKINFDGIYYRNDIADKAIKNL